MRKQEKCPYCNVSMVKDKNQFCKPKPNSITKDHIPPDCFFPEEYPEKYKINLITVKCCQNCNSNFYSEIDNRISTAMIFSVKGSRDDIGQGSEVLDFIYERKKSFKNKSIIPIYNSVKNIDLKTKNGIYLGKIKGIEIKDYDLFIQRVVKGLFKNIFKKNLFGDIKVYHLNNLSDLNLLVLDNSMKELIKSVDYKGENKEIFQYGYRMINDQEGYFITVFYKLIVDISLIIL